MENGTRPDLMLQLLLQDADESVWRADLVRSMPLHEFCLHEFFQQSDLILRDCSLNFARQCGCGAPGELLNTPVNRLVFGERIEDLFVHYDPDRLPFIVKFISVHASNGSIDHGYLNCIGLIASGFELTGMVGRRRDITHQLRIREERRELKDSLTEKEYEIFLGLVKGKTVKQIASGLGLVEKTVYFHIENIEKKMRTCGILDIVQKAYRLGFFDSAEADERL
ncbi:MAG: LuxR C-terminal-related transcriptional regulator [Acidobacteriota bacterium]